MTPQVPPIHGLTAAQVNERVARGESNAFKARVGRTYWDIVRDNIFNLFNIVLFSLLVIVLLFGDYATVLFAGFSVVTNSLLGMYQEIAAKRKLDQLAALAQADIRVYRDGKLTHVPMHDLVKDDVIPVEPGDRLVVDGSVLHSDAMEMDESQLTGESDAVMKDEGSPVYSGSFCVAGSGVMVATRVGRESTINKLASVAKAYKHVLTPTQQRIALIVQLAVIIMAVCTPMIFIAGYQNNASIFNLGTFRNAVVFVTSLVPQGLVLTATLSLTIGALVISRFQTLVQRVNAVESMANVTVLCFDKTGTLTRNKLTVKEILPLNSTGETDVHPKLQSYLGNLAHLNRTAAAVAQYYTPDGAALMLPPVRKDREIPFTSARKWGAVVLPEETLFMGAPERVLCPENTATIERAAALSRQGLRVLAFGRCSSAMNDSRLPDDREDLALIVLSDEIREDIHATLDEFRAQNVRLKVISGDNLETVSEIAGEAGMRVRHAYTGDQLEKMSEGEFDMAARDGDVFARVEPDTKRKIIAALKQQGEYVAMVGDGVNDVPALKEANLAVVMNDGAQISKDIGDIVLLNNAMSTLPRAFHEGRTITQTIFGTSKIFLVKNFYSLLFFIFAGFMAMPFPINPIQISWVTFGVINVPATLIAFRILRPAHMKAFRRDVLDYVVTAGFIGAVAMAFLYAFTYLSNNQDILESRSTMMLFITLYGVIVLWNTHGLEIFRPRSILRYKRLFVIGIVLAVFTILVPYLLPGPFEYVAPTPLEWGLVISVFLISIVVLHIAMRTRGLVSRIWRLSEP